MLAGSCSSEPYTYGYSNNAAAGGLNWDMSTAVLGVAPVPGMDISGVIYRYTAVKDRQDPFTVTVQNEDAINGGFVFREQDDWSGRSGATINKLVPLPYTPIDRWGTGSIETTGVGSVEDPSVVYTYRIDPCFDPQSSPTCPGYEPPLPPQTPVIDLYDALDDDAVRMATKETDRSLLESDEDERKDKDDEEEKEPLEKALAANDNALTLANEMTQNAMMRAINSVNMNTYYAATIPGGAYHESVMLVDSNLPDNKRAFRSMSQQRLHSDMVDLQYRR